MIYIQIAVLLKFWVVDENDPVGEQPWGDLNLFGDLIFMGEPATLDETMPSHATLPKLIELCDSTNL